MKKTVTLIGLFVLLFSCQKVELDKNNDFANPIKATSNSKIVSEKIINTKGAMYEVVTDGSHYYVRGYIDGKKCLMAFDGSLNLLWKKELPHENYNDIVLFKDEGNTYLLIVAKTVSLESSYSLKNVENIISVYDNRGKMVANKTFVFKNSKDSPILINKIKYAGNVVDGKAYFVFSWEQGFVTINFDVNDKIFTEHYGTFEFSGTPIFDFVFSKNPETTIATANTSLIAVLRDGGVRRLFDIPNLFTAIGNTEIEGKTIGVSGIYDTVVSIIPTYAPNGACQNLFYLVRYTLKKEGVQWSKSALLAFDVKQFSTIWWSRKFELTEETDLFYDLMFADNKLYLVGRIGAYQRVSNKKQFAYASIAQIDPKNGNVVETHTFGNEYYGSGFNGFVKLDNENEFVAVGYTNYYISEKSTDIYNQYIDTPVGNHNAWIAKIKL